VRLSLGAAALLLALAPGALRPYGGSTQAGLDGTQAWDTVPQTEADLAFWAYGGDGHPALGPGVRLGLWDQLQVSGRWRKALNGEADLADLGLELREADYPDAWPALALIADAPYDGSAWRPQAGVVAQVEPYDSSLTLNALWGADGGWSVRACAWTPYVAYFVRLGAELAAQRAGLSACTPQVLINGPGDISLALGCRIALPGGAVGWALRLNYDLFPNP
jgi:hypothetical protein